MAEGGSSDIGAQFPVDRGPAPASRGADAFRYVRAADGGLIDISEISPEDRYARGPYSCLACKHVMVPAMGRIRKHHFKHKVSRPADCYSETYLHQLAKMALFKGLSAAIQEGHPYWLTRTRPVICSHYQGAFGLTCTGQSAPFAVDLAARFDRVELESGVEGFVADVLLTSEVSGERMLLEVAVSHPCEERKLASGLPIIEIMINSEDAAGRLAYGMDTTSNSIFCHNLPDPEPAQHRCTTPCAATGLIALLYDSGKVWYAVAAIGDEGEILSDPHLLAYEIVDVALGPPAWTWAEIVDHLRAFMTRHAFEEGASVRSCLLCWNNGGRVSQHDILCIAKDRRVWMSSSASGCADYDPAADAEEAARLWGEQLNDRISRT